MRIDHFLFHGERTEDVLNPLADENATKISAEERIPVGKPRPDLQLQSLRKATIMSCTEKNGMDVERFSKN
jgi:hypothetical protein